MSKERGWFMGCFACGGNSFVRNAKIEHDKTCESCTKDGTEKGHPCYVLDQLVVTELGWCGCGNPEEVDRIMLAYLESRSGDTWPKPKPKDLSSDTILLLTYLADDLGWTEHGSSIASSWLTDDGKEALVNLKAAAELDHE